MRILCPTILLSSFPWISSSRCRSTWFCSCARRRVLPGRPVLLQYFGNGSRADGPAAFADGEPQALLHCHRCVQLDLERDVVSRHHHLGAFRKLCRARHIRRAEVELRTIAVEEWRMAPAL